MPSLGNMFNLNIRFTVNYGSCILCTFALFKVAFPVDLCSQFSPDTVESNFRHGVAPQGGANAGNFYKSDSANSFESCVESCCKNVICNVAFYFKDDCLLISCNTTWPEGCEPKQQSEEQFRDSLWLTLRTLETGNSKYVSPLPASNIPLETCETDSDCNIEAEVCRTVFTEITTKKRCECAPGFFRSSDNLPCSKLPATNSRQCIVGMKFDCLPEEDCIPKNSRSRTGTCQCRVGYFRHTLNSGCIPDAVSNDSLPKNNENVKNLTIIAATSSHPSINSATTSSSTLAAVVFNQSPVANVIPTSQEIQLPSGLVIDGSGSSDDVEIVSYRWEVASKPIDSHFQIGLNDITKPVLRLKSLNPGFYRFKLMVTDSQGLQDFAFSNATVIPEVDNPPVADAGPDVVVELPSASVMLYGNASRDDKRIVSYEWRKKSSDSPAVKMEGMNSPFLKLSSLQAGAYVFRLQVTDSSGQTSADDVHVVVKSVEQNRPPVALVGSNQTISVPVGVVILNGSRSFDDHKIESYTWTLISGPSSVVINSPHNVIASVSTLVVGQYLFQLAVWDETGLESRAITAVTVRKATDNQPPAARAGGNLVVTLPVDVVRINGSQSHDDDGIVSFKWTRHKSSPAAGDVLLNSDHESVLQLIDVVSGRYLFTVEVMDAEGLTSQDTMSLIVQPDPLEFNLVELRLVVDASAFTEKDKAMLTSNLGLLLGKINSSGTVHVVIRSIRADAMSGLAVIIFYVETATDKKVIWSGPEVVNLLKKTISSDLEFLGFQIAQVDTVVCQNNCSGHGICDPVTRRCHCDEFWMEDFIKTHFGERESNCNQNILYAVLVLVLVVLVTVATICTAVCLCKRCTYCKPKIKRHRYMLLEERVDDEDDGVKGNESLRLLRKGQRQNSSLMQSESDFSSEDTIYVNNKRPINGSAGRVPNGSVRKSKVTA